MPLLAISLYEPTENVFYPTKRTKSWLFESSDNMAAHFLLAMPREKSEEKLREAISYDCFFLLIRILRFPATLPIFQEFEKMPHARVLIPGTEFVVTDSCNGSVRFA